MLKDKQKCSSGYPSNWCQICRRRQRCPNFEISIWPDIFVAFLIHFIVLENDTTQCGFASFGPRTDPRPVRRYGLCDRYTYLNPFSFKSKKFPSLTNNCCSHQSFTLLEDIHNAIIVLVFWPLVSLLMLLEYVGCWGSLVRQIHNEKKQDKQWCW